MGEVVILPVVRVEREADGRKARMNRRRRRNADVQPIVGSLEIAGPIKIADTAPCEYVAPDHDCA